MPFDQLSCNEPQDFVPGPRHSHQEVADLLTLAVLRMCLPRPIGANSPNGRADFCGDLGPAVHFPGEEGDPFLDEGESGNSDSSAVSLGWSGQQSVNANPNQNKGVRS